MPREEAHVHPMNVGLFVDARNLGVFSLTRA
jgi:hypothetical protein